MKLNKMQKIVSAMRMSKGRFFGLGTKSGERLNAQYCYDTENTVVVYDRNKSEHRRFNKSSLASIKMGAVEVG